MRGAVGREGVTVEGHAEDDVVGGEIDFGHDVTLGHFLEEGGGVVFIHDVDAVADAFGVAEVDGLADMEAETGGRDEAGGDLAGVERDMDVRVDAVEVIEHAHLAGVLAHGEEVVFGLDEVDAHDVRVGGVRLGGGDFEAEEGLGEDLFGRVGAEDLVEKADFDGAGAGGIGLVAVLDLLAGAEGLGEVGAVGRDFFAEAGGKEFVAKGGELGGSGAGGVERSGRGRGGGTWMRGGGPAEVCAELSGVREGWGLHDFEVLLVLRGGSAGDFVEPLAGVGFCEAAETAEGGKELVVAAPSGRRDVGAHGEGVDEGVIEGLTGVSAFGGMEVEGCAGGEVSFGTHGFGRDGTGGADIFGEGEGGRTDAEEIGTAISDKGFGVDGAGKVHVEVGAFGHLDEEGMELEGVGLSGVEGAGGAHFGGGRAGFGGGAASRRRGCAGRLRKSGRREREEKEEEGCAGMLKHRAGSSLGRSEMRLAKDNRLPEGGEEQRSRRQELIWNTGDLELRFTMQGYLRFLKLI